MFWSRQARPYRSYRSYGSTPTASSRRRSVVRPSLEALEGRIVLNASALDPSFGAGGVMAVAPASGIGQTDEGQTVTALATQADGKIVAAVVFSGWSGNSKSLLFLRRYEANGTVDTSFGTNGQTSVPIPAYSNIFESRTPHDVVFAPDGSIVVGFNFRLNSSGQLPNFSMVARLTPTGQLDPSFGLNGTVSFTDIFTRLGNVAVQPDGRIIVTGSFVGVPQGGEYGVPTTFVVARLTTAGEFDTSFHQSGMVTYSATRNNGILSSSLSQNVAVDRDGLIYATVSDGSSLVTRINSVGDIDTSYGLAGTLTSPLSMINDLAIQPDGKLILGGNSYHLLYAVLVRLNVDGSTDTTFRGLSEADYGGIASRVTTVESLALGDDGKITVLGPKAVIRLRADGTPDREFGTNGLIVIRPDVLVPSGGKPFSYFDDIQTLDLTPTGNVVVGAGTALIQYRPILVRATVNDFDGDGKSDIAAQLGPLGIYAYRPSAGGPDMIQSFGQPGIGTTIPAPGDYNGDDHSDIGVQLTNFASFATRLTGARYFDYAGYQDRRFDSGTAGDGATIPANGDYDGDGITDLAVYLPATGTFTITFSVPYAVPYSGQLTVTGAFGIAGAGETIPAPGDYDGDGKTDLAAYLPSLGIFAYRPSSGGPDVLQSFGQVGQGASIPTPGDYDGDGITDLSIYLPSLGIYAYRPSSGSPDVLASFGQVGDGASIPAPGDYDGDGITDISVYLPSLAQFAYRPSSGGADVIELFGAVGTGQTVPTASIPYAQPRSSGTTSAFRVGAVTPSSAVFIPLTDDLTSPTTTKKKSASAV